MPDLIVYCLKNVIPVINNWRRKDNTQWLFSEWKWSITIWIKCTIYIYTNCMIYSPNILNRIDQTNMLTGIIIYFKIPFYLPLIGLITNMLLTFILCLVKYYHVKKSESIIINIRLTYQWIFDTSWDSLYSNNIS